MRTTIDIDDPILAELKRLQKKEGKSLGRLVSDLLAAAMGQARSGKKRRSRLLWKSKPMGARVDLADRDALLDAMDGPWAVSEPRKRPR
jgi:hypothetical protein